MLEVFFIPTFLTLLLRITDVDSTNSVPVESFKVSKCCQISVLKVNINFVAISQLFKRRNGNGKCVSLCL